VPDIPPERLQEDADASGRTDDDYSAMMERLLRSVVLSSGEDGGDIPREDSSLDNMDTDEALEESSA